MNIKNIFVLAFIAVIVLENVAADPEGWSDRVTVSESSTASFYSAYPSINVDAQGTRYITWYSNRRNSIVFRKYDTNNNPLTPEINIPIGVMQDCSNAHAFGICRYIDSTIDNQGNTHIVWTELNQQGDSDLYYMRIDSRGTIQRRVQLTNSPTDSLTPVIVVSGDSIIYVAWVEKDLPLLLFSAAYLAKLDYDGNRLAQDMMLSDYFGIPNDANPTITEDRQGNIHATWYRFPGVIEYTKIDHNFVKVINPMGVGRYAGALTRWRLTSNPEDPDLPTPVIVIDSQNNAHIFWNHGGEFLMYVRVLSDGRVERDERYILFANSNQGIPRSYTPLSASISRINNQDRISIVFPGTDDNIITNRHLYDLSFNTNGNGELTTRLTPIVYTHPPGRVPIQIVSADISKGPSTYSLGGDNYVVYGGQYREVQTEDVFYKKSVPYARLSIPGGVQPGATVPVSLSDTTQPLKDFMLILSLSANSGTPLGDGRIFPLDADILFFLSLSRSLGFENSGRLDANGQGSLSMVVPNEPTIRGTTFYTAFITFDASGIKTFSEPSRTIIE